MTQLEPEVRDYHYRPLPEGLDPDLVLDGFDGWELVEFSHVEPEKPKSFVYRHKDHGLVRILRHREWRVLAG